MGKPDTLDRTVQIFFAAAALLALLNGGAMLWHPLGWYQAVPSVETTGPANQHFIRDIGLAYLSCALLLGYAARYPNGRWLAALAGGLWLTAHGVLHMWEYVSGISTHQAFWAAALGTIGHPALVWTGLGILFARQRIAPAGIPKKTMINAFERSAPGESQYIREVAKAPGFMFEKFQNFMPAAMHRHQAPAELFHMARLGAILVEDCGPCALIVARSAANDGVSSDLVNAALHRSPPDGDLRTAFDFGQSIATQSAEAMARGDEIEKKFGGTVRLELALTAAFVRAYPAIKRGLGLTKPCSITQLRI